MKTARLQVFVCIVILFTLYSTAHGQSQKFSHFKSLGENIVVYFTIDGLLDDTQEHTRVLEALLYDSNISDGNVYYDSGRCVCQLVISPTVSVDYVESILQSVGYSIDRSTLANENPQKPDGFYNSKAYSFFSGFDGYKGYDVNNPLSKSKEDVYAENKENWIKEHPEEYQNAKRETGSTVIVKRKDLEFFKEEKRNYILDHPEIFIIED